MRKLFLFFLFSIFYIFSFGQNNNRGTIKIEKPFTSDCFNFKLFFATSHKDSLTVSEINKENCLIIYLTKCKENHSFPIQSYDLQINESPAIHYTAACGVGTRLKEINSVGTLITISNCTFKVITENESDKIIILPPKTFYIVSDKSQSGEIKYIRREEGKRQKHSK